MQKIEECYDDECHKSNYFTAIGKGVWLPYAVYGEKSRKIGMDKKIIKRYKLISVLLWDISFCCGKSLKSDKYRGIIFMYILLLEYGELNGQPHSGATQKKYAGSKK